MRVCVCVCVWCRASYDIINGGDRRANDGPAHVPQKPAVGSNIVVDRRRS
jgi:hypothetical protein